MKRNAIIESEFSVLENAIVDYGNVVTFSQLQQLFNKDIAYTRKRVSRLVDQGWLTRVKKGVFVISDLSTRGQLSISHQAIVNILVEEAYISFEAALQHHGLYDQMLKSIQSISLKRYHSTEIDGIEYKFINSQEKYFYGWETYTIDNQAVKIASIEKALIDLIQFHRTRYSTDLVLEKLSTFQDEVDITKLIDYILKSNLVTKRIFGFLMDCLKIDSNRILETVFDKKSVSSISNSNNNLYNNKWKLYYDQHFAKYIH